ncbi:MAG TPA: DUF333 domain-containing protein [Chloroflexota bacterium]|nr:DUF333 domain-containing protein [Chloroflexota bacterium]
MLGNIRFLLFGLCISLFSMACNQAGVTATPAEVEIANPASENCIQQGGQLEMRQNEAGEYGICVFANGRSCDEWALYHGVCEQHQVLLTFFDRLAAGEDAAAELYGGSYDVLQGYNPTVDPDDVATLWQNGCQINGLQCLPVRIANFKEETAVGETIFTVQFTAPDGSLFEREACCGDAQTTPPEFEFEFRVIRGEGGGYRVLDMPVYVP